MNNPRDLKLHLEVIGVHKQKQQRCAQIHEAQLHHCTMLQQFMITFSDHVHINNAQKPVWRLVSSVLVSFAFAVFVQYFNISFSICINCTFTFRLQILTFSCFENFNLFAQIHCCFVRKTSLETSSMKLQN